MTTADPVQNAAIPANRGRRSVGKRLTLCFVLIVSLMVLGNAVAFWQFALAQREAERLQQLDQGSLAVLRVRADVLSFWSDLSRLTQTHDAQTFFRDAAGLRASFTRDVDSSIRLLSATPETAERHAAALGILDAIRLALPSQVDAVSDLAAVGDWEAVRLRMQTQVLAYDRVTATLANSVDAEVGREEAETLHRIQSGRRQALLTLTLTDFVTLLIAVVLGSAVTRSITRPLAHLGAGARAVAAGNFEHQVSVNGGDELGDLASAFNNMARQLQNLYATLQRREAHFRTLIEHASDLIVVLNAKANMVYVSPASESVLGYPPDFLMGRRMLDYVHPEDAENARARWTLQESTQELRLVHADGSLRTVEAMANNLLDDSAVAGVVIAFRDITDRQRLERQLLQAQKMEAIGTLAGGIAHDFNNVLTVITGYSQLILESIRDPEIRTQVCYIREAGDHAATLTHQLLAFSRRQVLQPRVFDLNGLIARVEGMLRRLIGEDIEVVTVCASDLGMVRADPGQMEQVIMNLAVNARDAMPKGGTLTFETANVELNQEYICQHPELIPGPYIMLAVSDTGTGMSPEVVAHLFEPFFTTKETGRGTGLGLSMVYGIIKQSGGHVSVYTEVGRGSTFEVYLPRVDQGMVATESPRPGITVTAPGSETILLVEDQPQLRELTRAVLERAGYSVIAAETAPEALTFCQQSPTPIHLMLSDVVMPRLSGRELADQALRYRPEMKVLFMSGYAPSAVIQHGVLESGTFFLEKPFTPPALLQKLREVLDSAKLAPSKPEPTTDSAQS